MNSSTRAIRASRIQRLLRPWARPSHRSLSLALVNGARTRPCTCSVQLRAPISRINVRTFAERATKPHAGADEAIEEIQAQYETAMEELQIAAEETKENTVYAADDRAAAKDEFNKLKDLYEQYMVGESLSQQAKDEVDRRIGRKLKEIEETLRKLEDEAADKD